MKQENRDELTGLLTKEEYEKFLREMMVDDGADLPVSLAFFDIDHFLRVNTDYGGEIGDRVLKNIAGVFVEEFSGGNERVYRIGGDEFAVILCKTEKERAFLRLEKARGAVESLAYGETIDAPPTICIGVATFPDDGVTKQEIIRKADDALYRGKTDGRNRVTLAREEKKIPKTSHFTQGQLSRLSVLAVKEGVGEAELLREALDDLLKKYSS